MNPRSAQHLGAAVRAGDPALTSIICGLAPALHTAGRDLSNAMREASRASPADRGRRSRARCWSSPRLPCRWCSSRARASCSNLRRSRPDRSRCAAGPSAGVPCAARAAALSRCHALDRLLQGAAAAHREHAGRRGRGGQQRAASARQHVDAREVVGYPAISDPVQAHHVSAGYTGALGIRLAGGRLLTDSDVESAQRVALVNERSCAPAFRIVRRSARWSSCGG